MARPTHKKATSAACKTAPDDALVALVKALARDLAESDYERESVSAKLEDSAQKSPDQRS